ncbi:hypothetical protein [Emcibacter sp.]|uniref:hypothetical protein n=1 Tax=Emcibacter sp. TaxID=1979954 RepID=UPI002AA67CD7|nr:hypothetical protein [Emcibacter sp.]
MIKLSMTTAFWLGLASSGLAADIPSSHSERLFLNASALTDLKPLQFDFHKGQFQLGENSRELLKQWAEQIKKYSFPIHIYSYAATPESLRDMTENRAKHEAVRVAFNRGLIARALLEQTGIASNRIRLHAIGSGTLHSSENLKITIRQD